MTNLKLKEVESATIPQVETDRARVKSRSSVVSLFLTAASFLLSYPQCRAWHTVDTPPKASCMTEAGMEVACSFYTPDPLSSNGPAPNLGLDRASHSTHLNRNEGKEQCHKLQDALQAALASFCTEVDYQGSQISYLLGTLKME